MIRQIEKFLFFFILILPITLITGPAIPDITITFAGIFALFIIVSEKKYLNTNIYQWETFSIIFWLFLILISLFSVNKYLAYRDAIIFLRILFIPIFVYFVFFKENNRIKNLLLIILISILFVCLDTIYQFTNYDPEIGFGKDIFGNIPNFYSRLTGPFEDLIPGSYVSKFSLFGLAFIFIFFKENILKNILCISYITLSGFVTYISNERMALATFLLALVFLTIFYNKRRIIFFMSLVCTLISIFIINKIHPIYNDYEIIDSKPYHLGLTIEKKFSCKNNRNEECKKIIKLQPSFFEVLKNFNDSAYGQIYLVGLKMWKDHPFQGIGLNNFKYLCNNIEKYKNMMNNYNCATHPHNFYLQWLVETGIFGLCLFIVYILFIFNFVLKRIRHPYAYISLATLIIIFFPIMSTGSFLKNWMGISSFFIIGVCLALASFKQKN